MTLNDIVYSEKLTYDEKHTELNRLLNQIQNQTSWRKYNFDPKYNFSQEWENLSPNAQWKEVQLGLDIVNLKKYWAKEYKYEDIHKTFNSKLFRDWFRPYINLGSIRRKNKEQGLKFYNFHKEKVSIKQAIKWINTLIDLWLITKDLGNKFFALMECKYFDQGEVYREWDSNQASEKDH